MGNEGLVVEGDCTGPYEEFALKMLTANKLPGFIEMNIEEINNISRIVYDISSKQSLLSLSRIQNITMPQMREFIRSLKNAADVLPEYLLDPGMILLDPGCIYADDRCCSFFFCACPYKNTDSQEQKENLADMIISNIDYKDTELVQAAYQLNMALNGEKFNINDLYESCFGQSLKDEETDVRNVFDGSNNNGTSSFPGHDQTAQDIDLRKYISIPDIRTVHGKKTKKAKNDFLGKLKDYIKESGLI